MRSLFEFLNKRFFIPLSFFNEDLEELMKKVDNGCDDFCYVNNPDKYPELVNFAIQSCVMNKYTGNGLSDVKAKNAKELEDKKQLKAVWSTDDVNKLCDFIIDHAKDDSIYVNEFKLLRPDSDENLVSDCKKLVDEKFGSLDKIDYDRSKIKDSFKDEKGDDQWKEILFYVLVKLTNKHELLKQRYKYGFDNIKWLYNKSIEENLPDYIKKVSENTNQSDATYSKCLTWINDFAKKSNGKQDAILYFLNALSDKDEKKIINLYIEYKKKDFAAFEEIDKLNLKEEYWDNLFNIKENSVLAKAFKQTFIYFYNENNVVKKADEKNFDDVISIKHIVDNFNFKEINDTKTNWKKSYNSDQLKFMKLTDKYVDFMHLKYNDFDGFWEKAFDKLDVNKIKRDDKLNDEEDTKLIPLYDLCVALHTKNDKDVLTACQKYANGCESFRNGNRKNGEKFYDDIDYISAFSKDQKAQQLTNDYVLLSKLRYGFVLISDIALYLALEEYLGPDNKCSGFKIRADYSGKTSTLSRVSKEIISQAKINLKK